MPEMATINFRQEEEPKNVIRALIWKTELRLQERAKTVKNGIRTLREANVRSS